jgi:diguanylate cyclase (GGDEF)-like protein
MLLDDKTVPYSYRRALRMERLTTTGGARLACGLFASIAVLDWWLAPDASLAHLYYLPILLAAVRVSGKLALALALASMLVYHVLDPDLAAFHYGEADVVQLVSFLVVGSVAARLAQQEREMRRLAGTDDLTGLHNLRSLEANVRDALESAHNRGDMAAMLAVDVDRLKALNDAYGHLVGADAVRHVGHLIGQQVPRRAIACRYGGDEFLIFIPRCGPGEALCIAERICGAVRASAALLAGRFFAAGSLSVSVGVSARRMTGDVAVSAFAEAMFRQTDGAMYLAKERGRGVVVLDDAVLDNALLDG